MKRGNYFKLYRVLTACTPSKGFKIRNIFLQVLFFSGNTWQCTQYASLSPKLTKIASQIKQPALSSQSSKSSSSGLWDFSILCQTNGMGEENYTSKGEFCIFSCWQNCFVVNERLHSQPPKELDYYKCDGAWMGAWAGFGNLLAPHHQ